MYEIIKYGSVGISIIGIVACFVILLSGKKKKN